MTFSRLSQPEKAFFPIEMTEFGIEISVRPETVNVLLPMEVTVFRRVTEDKSEHSQKA